MNAESIDEALEKRGYKIIGIIGKGAFSTFFEVTSEKYPDEKFVAKISHIDPKGNNEKTKEIFVRETSILKTLTYRYVVRIYDFFNDGNYYVLILEKCPGGCAFGKIKKNWEPKHDELEKCALDLFSTLDYLRSNGVAHHDIKPANFLFDNFGRMKLSDFGLSKRYNDGETTCYKGGTVEYQAPEIFLNERYDPFQADMWSAGVSLYQMATLVSPFLGKSKEETIEKIKSGVFPPFPSNFDTKIGRIIIGCLTLDPNLRYNPYQCLSILRQTSSCNINNNKIPRHISLMRLSSLGRNRPTKNSTCRTILSKRQYTIKTTLY